jgi:DMSO/TMAO reductase YedYZ molybdopterin-dependent catalytic subunit
LKAGSDALMLETPITRINRRQWLSVCSLASGAILCDFERLFASPIAALRQERGFQGGRLLGVIDFSGEAAVPMERVFGAELDGRMYTDLSKLELRESITQNASFYVRTCASKLLEDQSAWVVRVHGLVSRPFELDAEDLRTMAKPMGTHLMECAGNSRSVHFGMISVARWKGAPWSDLLERAEAKSIAKRVLISGFDDYTRRSVSSVAGASWIFTVEELKDTGAFFATEMNGVPLARDHGAPVRLVVPGWYGCTCIKWVNQIHFVDDTAAATSQMQEYAARTMQIGVPQAAREYKPAIIEPAAMPIRIEKWAVDGKIRYRVVGIAWGGSVAVKRLEIRFNPEEEYAAVDDFQGAANDPWSFWTHSWAPKQPGTYMIRLRVADPRVMARRLEAGYYMRSVEISEV